MGSAYLRDRHEGPVLLMAGGSGLAPIESILRQLIARRHAAPVRLYVGARTERDVYHEAHLARWAAEHPAFSYEIVLSEPAGGSRRGGFLHEAVDEDLAGVDGMKAYLAGPPPMVEAATRLLKARGMASRDIHADAFHDQNQLERASG
jgi:CDP-4-dehydro-6-deoxyglucose reductase/ferredoxin-NAD(P)+ reductase (naphthalene dioxygenase ferredoxin-specific)